MLSFNAALLFILSLWISLLVSFSSATSIKGSKDDELGKSSPLPDIQDNDRPTTSIVEPSISSNDTKETLNKRFFNNVNLKYEEEIEGLFAKVLEGLPLTEKESLLIGRIRQDYLLALGATISLNYELTSEAWIITAIEQLYNSNIEAALSSLLEAATLVTSKPLEEEEFIPKVIGIFIQLENIDSRVLNETIKKVGQGHQNESKVMMILHNSRLTMNDGEFLVKLSSNPTQLQEGLRKNLSTRFPIGFLYMVEHEMEGKLVEFAAGSEGVEKVDESLRGSLGQAYGKTIREFLGGKNIDFTSELTFFNMYSQFYKILALYNELAIPYSGTSYTCAASLKDEAFKNVCNFQLEQLFFKYGSTGYKILNVDFLPKSIIQMIQSTYFQIGKTFIIKAAEYIDKIQEAIKASRIEEQEIFLELPSSTIKMEFEKVEIKSNLTTTTTNTAPKDRIVSARSAVIKENVQSSKDKLFALIKSGGTPILKLDTLTPLDYSHICSEIASCTTLVGNLAPATVISYKEILKGTVCNGFSTRDAIESLPLGELRDVWGETCAFGKTGYRPWLVYGIISALLIVIIVISVCYITFQQQKGNPE